jgi:hypothetical protein
MDRNRSVMAKGTGISSSASKESLPLLPWLDLENSLDYSFIPLFIEL